MDLNEIYFWTSTIKDWKNLLCSDQYKQIIIDNLKKLVNRELVSVYAFVIMPNHIHLIWELLRMNGKEKPHASFNKATAHEIIQNLKRSDSTILNQLKVDQREREFRVWQRDPLAVLTDSRKKLEQKLEYIHLNPLQRKWNLVERPELYRWSSASYYESESSEFDFITHYRDVI